MSTPTLAVQTSSLLDRTSQLLAKGVRWFALLMVVITLAVVILRYALDIGAIALQESVMYLHAALFLLGIPYALKINAHVRVDMLYANLTVKQQSMVDLAGHVLFLIPISTLIFWTSLPYVAASWRVLEGSAEVGGIPGIFLLKTLIPIMAVLLFLQGIGEILKCLSELRKANP